LRSALRVSSLERIAVQAGCRHVHGGWHPVLFFWRAGGRSVPRADPFVSSRFAEFRGVEGDRGDGRSGMACLPEAVVRMATLIHCTTAMEQEDLARLGFCKNSVVVPVGVELSRVVCTDVADVSVGVGRTREEGAVSRRLHPMKGLDLLIEAWKTNAERHPDWRLIMRAPMSRTR
jgi:glycosyltransferase involved in cell wall biosynthesis